MTDRRLLRRHESLARAVDRAAEVERPAPRVSPPFLVHPSVTTACAPLLWEIAVLLRDGEQRIDPSVLRLLDGFLHDGSSAFFGRDVRMAARELALLKHDVENGRTPAAWRPARRALRLGSPAPVRPVAA